MQTCQFVDMMGLIVLPLISSKNTYVVAIYTCTLF